MKKTSLQEQTSDPRWQRKRLEILERDKWTCKQCGDTETTLTVHHKSYRMEGGKFVDYWDYHERELITLCNRCHENEESELLKLKNNLYYTVRDLCENAESINGVTEMLIEIYNRKQSRIEYVDFIVVQDLAKEMFVTNATTFFSDIDEILERCK